jgi:alkylhydroperoxidase family enzyme
MSPLSGSEPSEIKLGRVPASNSLASHPALAAYVECFLNTFLVHGRLDARLREMVILRIAWDCEQPFEWASHHRIARRVGVSNDDIVGVRDGPTSEFLGMTERTLLTAADEIVVLGRITEATYSDCRSRLGNGDDLALEFLHMAAGYRMMAIVLSTSNPSLDDAGLALWPPDGVGPADVAFRVGLPGFEPGTS